MKLYKIAKGILLEHHNAAYIIDDEWDSLINRDDLAGYLQAISTDTTPIDNAVKSEYLNGQISPPIGSQEVWAAGVTYLKSRDARMEESETSGGASLYDRVYDAPRPELFFKATAQRVAGHGAEVYIRKDSEWDVPEPELTLFINSKGSIQGYTIGNDMSSRSIEGENALYLPQAKIYEKSAALGPCLLVTPEPIALESAIRMTIKRDGVAVYEDATTISRMKRSLTELAGYLYRECDFPAGCFLMTGTCLVPPPTFTLQPGDVAEISIDGIGTLVNTIALNPKHK
ncbi:fumarylacetoacetate hydrolase family protein [Mucilaginibacter sabulilitoris]|uniref:Fumarylacetoacetate hydrolase family protein n=1 Tax=Mucilaginibacter sabulilitoris TaxID=1173583 RepID=A0ABZ0TRQ6_9SPHI|nr:fumarylacetoacetate hydrolase family protein [Mucilaginibacter sabulilitoris]WPU93835.1 fumarylacetoacetate hydrolase family protein [Mucilaginibacter sabulilitoris]